MHELRSTRGEVSPQTLVVLAAVVWYAGAVVLALKGGSLLLEASALAPASRWPWVVGGIGLAAGAVKAWLLFRKSCRKNLDRIARLERPRPWQFYRTGFFIALALMITLGATLSRMAHGRFEALLAVGALDLSIAAALLGGSVEFWRPGRR